MKTYRQRWIWAVIVAGLVLMLQTPLEVKAQDTQVAQDPQTPQDAASSPDQDPPSRAARLNFIEGSVSFQPEGENDWVEAEINRPLANGDNLWADENSRAEVHIGSTALRLSPKTGITLLDVSDRIAQIRLAQGSLVVKVRHVDEDDGYEIDTPNVAFVPTQAGEYRIDVDPDGRRTDITVWRGRGEITGGGSSYTVVADQHASFTGADQLAYDVGQIPAHDGFDTWAFNRDQAEEGSESVNYVSRDMSGYEDLDAYGDWTYVAGYGMSWRPRAVVVGWAPYRFGHWAWVGPWGWTWVESEPWGFAPFHYGRWAYSGTAWLWIPGPSAVRPIYAPALVSWVGGGPRANFAFSFGAGVGWFPLAPGEVFIPGYRVSRSYVNRVNTTNTTVNVTRVNEVYNSVVVNRSPNNITYANRGVSGGVTVVSRETFVNARPVAGNVVSVPAKELAAAPVSHTLAVEPVRGSLTGAGRQVAMQPPAAVTSRPVVALRTPAAMPGSSAQSQTTGSGNLTHVSIVRQQAPGVPVANPVRQSQAQTQSGSRSFEATGTSGTQAKTAPRVWEEQGTPESERYGSGPSDGRTAQSSGRQSTQQLGTRPVTKSVTPVPQRSAQPQREEEPKYSSWHPQKVSAAQAQSSSHSTSTSQSHATTSHTTPPPKN
jgi:hypothetical protein